MDILLWILFGGLAGWIASKIMKTDAEQGIIANVIVGIIGAAVGGFLMRMVTGGDTDSWLGSLLVAILGAIVVLALWKAITGRRHA